MTYYLMRTIKSKRAFNHYGFYYVLPNKMKNKVLIDGFFAAQLKKND